MCAMNHRLLRPRASGRFLLDQFGGAAAAYSLRRLSSSYTGPAVQVRRSSDSAEETFTPEQIANGSLTAWVGGGNSGFVKTWYDQSGKDKHVSQSTAIEQPRIVNSGSIEAVNGSAAVRFVASSSHVLQHNGNALADGPVSIFAVVLYESIPAADLAGGAIFDSTTNQVFASSTGFRFDNTFGDYRIGTNSTFTTTDYTTTGQQVLRSGFATASGREIYQNGSIVATTSGDLSPSFAGVMQHKIGGQPSQGDQSLSANFMDGYIQEVIVYNLDQRAVNASISSNINTYYGVF